MFAFVTASAIVSTNPDFEFHVVMSNTSSYENAEAFCQTKYGGGLIENDDIDALYSDTKFKMFAGNINSENNLFWTKEHLQITGFINILLKTARAIDSLT